MMPWPHKHLHATCGGSTRNAFAWCALILAPALSTLLWAHKQLPNAGDGKTRGFPSPEARAAPERQNGRPFPFWSIAGYCRRRARPTLAADEGSPWETRHSQVGDEPGGIMPII